MRVEVGSQTTGSRKSVGESTTSPFTHKFKTESNSYIYDVNSGEIVRVDEVVWQIMEDSCQEKEAVVAKYRSQFKPDEILRAYGEIQQARATDGLFSGCRPSVMVPLSKEEVAQRLDTSRHGLTLNVTEHCNFRCTYCPFTYNKDGTSRHRARHMTWEIAKAAIDDFLAHCKTPETISGLEVPAITKEQAEENFQRRASLGPPTQIGFYGGEPLLNFPVIKRATEYVRQSPKGKHMTFGLSTNGYLLAGDVADFLGANRFHLRVSVDGPPAIHDKQRRTLDGSPSWGVVMDNVRRFIAKYPDLLPNLGATLGPTVDVHEALRRIATAPWIAPLQSVMVAIAQEPYAGYNRAVAGTDDFARKGDLIDKYTQNLLKGRMNVVAHERELNIQHAMFSGLFEGLHTKRWRCAVARQTGQSLSLTGQCIPGLSKLLVSVDGDYLLCEKFPEDENFRFGHVSTGIDIEKAYRIFQEFFAQPREQCENCWCVSVCPIGCYAALDRMREGAGPITKADRDKACATARQDMHKKIIAYCRILERNPEALDFYGLNSL